MKNKVVFGVWFSFLILVSVLLSSDVLSINQLNNDIFYRYSFDNDYTDTFGNVNGTGVGSVSIDTNIKKLGSGSLHTSGGHVEFFSNILNQMSYNRTLNAWIRFNQSTSYSRFIWKGNFNVGSSWGVWGKVGTTLGFSVNTKATAQVFSVPNINEWVMVTAYINSTHICLSYNANNVSDCKILPGINDISYNLWFGKDEDSGQTFLGYMDEIVYWNKTLTANDISFLYNSGLGNSYPYSTNTTITPNTVISPYNVSLNGSVIFSWNDFSSSDNSSINYDLIIDDIIVSSGILTNTTSYNTNNIVDGSHLFKVQGCSAGHINCQNSTTSNIFNTSNTPTANNLTDIDFVIGGNYNITYITGFDPSNDILHYNLWLFNSSWYNIGTSSVLYIGYDYSNYSDGSYNQKIEVCDSFNNCDNSTVFSYIIDNTPPFINITYPVNEFDFTNGSVVGVCDDNNFRSISFSDSLFIGVNETPFNYVYNGSVSQINLTVNITCVDSADNFYLLSKVFNFDVNSPLCVGNLGDVTVDYASHYSWDISCGDDLNLFLLNVTCVDKTGVITYSYFKDNINATQFNFSDSSGSIVVDNVCSFIASDSHTKNDITNDINRFNSFVNSDGTGVVIPSYNPVIDYVGVYNVDSLYLDFGNTDRVKYVYNFSGSGRRVYDFYVYSNNGIVYVPDNYNAHFVIDNNIWIDFDLLNLSDSLFSYVVTRVNSTVYAVSLTTNMTEFHFNSVGIVNTRTYVQNIYARASGYLSTVLTTGTCPESIQGSIVTFTLLLFVSFIYLLGLLFNVPILSFISSLGVLGLSLSLVGCGGSIGIVIIGIGIIMFVVAIFRF